jgi:hypothetical protein
MANETEWTTRVAAWRESGQSAAAFCADKEYSASTLYYRARQPKGRKVKQPQSARVALARVVRRTSASTLAAAPLVIQVGSARVEVATGADRETLSELLHALADSPWGGQL